MAVPDLGGVSEAASAISKTPRRRRTFNTRLMVLLLLFAYSGLSVYSGNFLPLRLVNGDSMEPALFSGDIVLLRGTPFSEINTGDIVAYRVPDAAEAASGSATILHRVEKTAARNGQRVLITKGDNSSTDPWPVTADQVQGKQTLRIPALGKPVVMLTSPRGILFVSIAILISLLYIPAMVMFHATVLRKPGQRNTSSLKGPRENRRIQPGTDVTIIDAVASGDELPDPGERSADGYLVHVPAHSQPAATEGISSRVNDADALLPIVEAVEGLTDEQKQVRDSLVQLSDSISEYATHLKSHTSAVQSLARVAELLEKNIERQTALMERGAGQDSTDTQLSQRPKSVYL